jgi:hypothetical protein
MRLCQVPEHDTPEDRSLPEAQSDEPPADEGLLQPPPLGGCLDAQEVPPSDEAPEPAESPSVPDDLSTAAVIHYPPVAPEEHHTSYGGLTDDADSQPRDEPAVSEGDEDDRQLEVPTLEPAGT